MSSWFRRNTITIIALFAYFMMSLMIVMQSRIIDNQRTLIQQLFGDSLELTAIKVHQIESRHRAK